MSDHASSPVLTLGAEFLAAARDHAQLPPPAFAEVAFAGRSNVGKSSLINSLTGRKKLVRTSSTPGCTRGLALFRLNLRLAQGDAVLDFVDLPGYGYARRSKTERFSWGPMIERFLEHRVGLRAVIVIVDVRRGPEPDDIELLDYLAHIERHAIVVATKTDKLPSSKRKLAVKAVSKQLGRPVFGYSSKSGEGMERLWAALLRACALGQV